MPGEPSKPKEGVQVSMRHTKITAAEAAMLAGELNKPSWQSRNEGIHERVSFEDSIWGFDLAGGAYYKTPLRVTAVKTDSRAEKAGIRPGDRLLRINDIDTSTLTIQEAHEIIIESGIHLRIAVTAPEDLDDSYFCWEDPLDTGYDSEEERRKQREEERKKRPVHAKVSSYWSLQWPWVSKRRVIYRESNCFMVPSKYEDKHRDLFPVPTFGPKVPEDIVLHSKDSENQGKLTSQTPLDTKPENPENSVPNGTQNDANNGIDDTLNNTNAITAKVDGSNNKAEVMNNDEHKAEKLNDNNNLTDENNLNGVKLNDESDISEDNNINNENDIQKENSVNNEENSNEQSDLSEDNEEVADSENVQQETAEEKLDDVDANSDVPQDDDVIEEVLAKPDDVTNGEEETIINDILNDVANNDEVKR